tara:strand:- start:977 stop:1117 length:141 start_codon:yes stop_codon:yes gene_type:complete
MFDIDNSTILPLGALSILIISFLSLLVFQTLKEGRKALKEINKNSS